MTQPDPWNAQIFARRLHPHRSLTPRGHRILVMIFAACCFVSSLPFLFVGAWPVVGFMGLDVLVFWLAFRASFRAARAYEDLRVTPLEVSVEKVTPKGARSEWRDNPLWVRLLKEEHEAYGVERLTLRARGRGTEVASFLGPDAKAELAADLSRALAEARRGPRFS